MSNSISNTEEINEMADELSTSQELGSLESLGREWRAGNEVYWIINVPAEVFFLLNLLPAKYSRASVILHENDVVHIS